MPQSRLTTTDTNNTTQKYTKAQHTTSPSSKNRGGGVSNLITLAVCASGICFCYLSYGLILEHIFKSDVTTNAKGPITSFLLLGQTTTNVFVAWFWLRVQRRWGWGGGVVSEKSQEERKCEKLLNHRLILIASFCYFGAMQATNESLNYVTYPTATLAKSSKLIPTMLTGTLLERKTYDKREWLGAALITIGIATFNLSRASSAHNGATSGEEDRDSPYGLVLLLSSLVMDGLLSSLQSVMKRPRVEGVYRPPNALETMLYMNLYALLFICPLSFLTGQLQNGIGLVTSSSEAVRLILFLNAAAAAGQIFIFFTIHVFSPLMCTTITTTRKFLTICVSVIKFGHVLSMVEWGCVGLVFSGIYLAIVSKVAIHGTKKGKSE